MSGKEESGHPRTWVQHTVLYPNTVTGFNLYQSNPRSSSRFFLMIDTNGDAF